MANLQQSQTQFRDTNPGTSGMKFLYGTGSDAGKVIAATISTSDCQFSNFSAEFESLETFTVHDTTFTITERAAQASWFYFRVTPVTFSSSSNATGSSCLDTSFVPSTTVDFTNNVYNVTFNSQQQIRGSSFLFDIDNELSGSSAQPQNVRNILDLNAVTASVQDSFFTSLANITGRHLGSKTTEEEYGISPAFTAVARQAAFYSIDTEDTFILGQEDSDRNIEEYFLIVETDVELLAQDPYSLGVRVPTGSTTNDLEPNVRYQFLGHQTSLSQDAGKTGKTIKINNTTLRLNVRNHTEPGDVLLITGSMNPGYQEVVEILTGSGIYTLPKTNPELIDVKRNVTEPIRSYIAAFGTAIQGVAGTENFTVYKLNGDIIFRTSGNELFKARGVKLYDIESETIFLTGNDGRIIFNSGSQF